MLGELHLQLLPSDFSAELIILSDLHIRGALDERYLTLLNLLKQLSTAEVKNIVFLGDVFDFCFGYSKHIKREYFQLPTLLNQAIKNGTKVYFVEGNHEFAPERLAWGEVQIIKETQFILSMTSGLKIVFCHGDLLNAPPSYLWFRAFIKSNFAIQTARLLPDNFFNALAHRLADTSRAMETYRKIDHRPLLKEAFDWVNSNSCDIGIFGHFHIPYSEHLTTPTQKALKIFCLPSWYTPNILTFENNQFARYFFSKNETKKENVKTWFPQT